MSEFHVLLTDHPWPEIDIERRVLADAGAELVEAGDSSAEALRGLAEKNQVDAIMTCWAEVPAEVIAASPKCRHVARLGIGLDNIDVDYCSEHGIPVTNVPHYCLTEVAEHTIALLLALGRKVAFYHHQTKEGRYDLKAGPTLRRIEGQTLGIVGLGNIGRRVAEKARALGLKIVATSRSGREAEGVDVVSLEELLAQSDYVSLHVPLSEQTRHLIGREQLGQMKPSAYLINTARGGLVDHAALAEALDAGRLAGAALDVQEPEPPDLARPPFSDPRVIVTPHAAFASEESLLDLRQQAAQQVAARLRGEQPQHVVNRSALS